MAAKKRRTMGVRRGRARGRARGKGRVVRSRSGGGSRAGSRARSRAGSRARSKAGRKIRDERFHNRIKMIKDKVSSKHKIQMSAVGMINSFINDIIRNVTDKARLNTALPIFRNKTITYYDVMAAALDVFGQENKWIKHITERGETRSEDYQDKSRFSHPTME